MEIIYSAQRRNFEPGRVYHNPKYFDGRISKHATSVLIIGDWPEVEEAYRAAEIPVRRYHSGRSLPEKQRPDPINPGSDDDPVKLDGGVIIPDDLESLGYAELKALVAEVDPGARFASKQECRDFLESRR